MTKLHKETNMTTHLKGLGIVELLIDVHFEEKQQDNLIDLQKLNRDVYCITDYGAVIYNQGFISSIGKVFLLREGKLDNLSGTVGLK